MSFKEVLISLFLLVAGVIWARADPGFTGHYSCISERTRVSEFLDQHANANYEDDHLTSMATSGVWILQRMPGAGKTWRVLPQDAKQGDLPERGVPNCTDDDLGEISKSYGMGIKEYEKGETDSESECKETYWDYDANEQRCRDKKSDKKDGQSRKDENCNGPVCGGPVKPTDELAEGEGDEFMGRDAKSFAAGPTLAGLPASMNQNPTYGGHRGPGVAGGPPSIPGSSNIGGNDSANSSALRKIMDGFGSGGGSDSSSVVSQNQSGSHGLGGSRGGGEKMNKFDEDLAVSAESAEKGKKLIRKWSEDSEDSLSESSNCDALFGSSKDGASEEEKWSFIQQASGCLGEVFDMVGDTALASFGRTQNAIAEMVGPDSSI